MSADESTGSAPEPVARVLMVCDLIAPGGGPTGYTYNLRTAFQALHPIDIDVRFAGLVIETRNRATGEAPTGRAAPSAADGAGDAVGAGPGLAERLRRRLGRLRHTVGYRVHAGMSRELRAQIAESDLVVFQGYQDWRRLRFARARGAMAGYMPHSPTIRADEFRMLLQAKPGLRDRWTAWRMTRNERQAIRVADVVVFPTENAAGEYVKAFGRELARTRISYVISGVPGAEDPAEPAVDRADARPVLFVGRYVAHKGYDLFLAAAEEVKSEYPDMRFATLGGGPDARSSWAVEELGWQDAPLPTIAGARFIVVPSRISYFDLLPLEAAAQGVGLVFTGVGGNIDQQALLPDSVLCAVGDVADGIRRAEQLLREDPDWGRRNEVAFREHFTAERMAQRWLELIRELTGFSSGSRSIGAGTRRRTR